MATQYLERITSFERDQLRFDVIDNGPLDGKPVVLLHGFPETAQSWDKVTAILNQHHYRTFAIQQRGYSLSARPAGRYAYRISELVEDVRTFLDIIGQPVYLISHDWGALVAGELTRKYPKLIKHLTLISVPHRGAFIKACFNSSQLLKSYYIAVFQLPVVPEFVMKRLPKFRRQLLKSFAMTDDQIAIFEQDFVEQDRLTTALNWYRALPFGVSPSIAEKIAVPTLYIWGKKDSALSYAAAKFNKEFFLGKYDEYFLDANHWIPYQNAETFTDYFLKSVES